MTCRFLETIGSIVVIIFIIKIVQKILRTFNRFTPEKLRSMGKWAVITGATDGIGKAYAENLAEKGISVVLISRSQVKLEKVAKEIENSYHVETKIITADFKEPKKIYENIANELESLDIGILINNVGMIIPVDYFHLQKDQDIEDILNVNIISVIKMTQIVLPGMLKRKKGLVINISSSAVLTPATPLITTYGSTKAFVQKFNRDLSVEHRNSSVYFQCVLPGVVKTNMGPHNEVSWSSPSPNTFVEHAMNTIGVDFETTGYWGHSFLISIGPILDLFGVGKMFMLHYMINDRLQRLNATK